VDVVIGRVGRAHGVHGELAVDLRTDEPDERFAVGARLGTDPESAGPLTVAATRAHGDRLLVRFAEVPDRTAAEGLRGVLLTVDVPPSQRPADPDEFYDHQLVGLRVFDHDGRPVGAVAAVVRNPGHHLLVVRRDGPDGDGDGGDGDEVLVPFVAELVPEVDLDRGRLTVADRPGLLGPGQVE
jgi:16S rRNA processing protein RimM